jgi:hypothetical protein
MKTRSEAAMTTLRYASAEAQDGFKLVAHHDFGGGDRPLEDPANGR